MSNKRPLIIEVPIENIISEDDEQPALLYCTYNKVYLKQNSPRYECESKFGYRCAGCKYAYMQIIAKQQALKDVEELLDKIGAKPLKKEEAKQGRFENIM